MNELYLFYLFNIDNFMGGFIPCFICYLSICYSMNILLWNIVYMIIYAILSTYVFDLLQQCFGDGPYEDARDKPYRPIPAHIITLQQGNITKT
jgi:hypothetical protein